MSLGGVRNLKLGVFLKDLSMWAAGERVLQNALPPAPSGHPHFSGPEGNLLGRAETLLVAPVLHPSYASPRTSSVSSAPSTRQSVHTTGSSMNNHLAIIDSKHPIGRLVITARQREVGSIR